MQDFAQHPGASPGQHLLHPAQGFELAAFDVDLHQRYVGVDEVREVVEAKHAAVVGDDREPRPDVAQERRARIDVAAVPVEGRNAVAVAERGGDNPATL